MKIFTLIGIVLLSLVARGISAQQDLTGTWQGKLSTAPGNELTVQFIIARGADGAYTAKINSPDTGGISNVDASGVSYAGGQFSLAVESLGGSFAGALKDGALDGQWTQEDGSFPLRLAPYTKPVLSEADIESLLGSWVGKLTSPLGELSVVFRFERNAAGEFVGFLDSPDQGANGISIETIELGAGKLLLKIARVRGEYNGQLTGDEIAGEWSQLGTPAPLTLKRGSYVAQTHPLMLDAAAQDQLRGTWRGQLGPLALVFRFETTAKGEFIGLADSPTQGATGIAITGASVADGRITLTIRATGGTFTAPLASDKLDGTWTQLGMSNPLVMTKE